MSAAVELCLARLGTVGFRNLEAGSLQFASGLNVIFGENGQGKTSLIEAIYLLCTTRSFRTTKLSEVIQTDALQARLKGSFERGGLPWTLEAQISQRGRSFLKNGARPKERLLYVQSTPVVAFHPGDLLLITGAAQLRRRLLDRIILHRQPGAIDAKRAFDEAAKKRLFVLEQRPKSRELEAFEAVMAENGALLSGAREQAVIALEGRFSAIFARLAREDLSMSIFFRPGGTTNVEEFRRRLEESRAIDQRRKMTTYGPERDELIVSLDGRPARAYGSQGQQRMLALSLKLAELELIRESSLTCPILLLDDVSSELDRERTEAVFRFLGHERNQVFVTTTRPELFADAGRILESASRARADFRVEMGRISPL